MYGVNSKITGSGAGWSFGRYTVALSSTPSRIGIFTPQVKSTGFGGSGFFCASCAPSGRPSNISDRVKRRSVLFIWIPHFIAQRERQGPRLELRQREKR